LARKPQKKKRAKHREKTKRNKSEPQNSQQPRVGERALPKKKPKEEKASHKVKEIQGGKSEP